MNVPEYAAMILEILIFTGLFYVILRFLRETRGSGVIRGLTVIIAVGAVGFLVLIETFQLHRLRMVYDNLVSIALIGLIVVFQPEIRRAITQLGDQRLFHRLMDRVTKRKESRGMLEVLTALQNMAPKRTGALIAIEQVAGLHKWMREGVQLESAVSSFLLESIFFPNSPLHDGCVIIRENRIVAAGCVLPVISEEELERRTVTRRRSKPKRLGTRHRAALGLSVETDALILVASEETGAISVAHKGKLHLNLDEIEIRGFLKLPTREIQREKELALHG